MNDFLHGIAYVKAGTGAVCTVTDHRLDTIHPVITLIGETIEEVIWMAHGKYGVPYTNIITEKEMRG